MVKALESQIMFIEGGSRWQAPNIFYLFICDTMVEEASLSPCFMLSSGQFLFIFCLFFFPYLCLIIYVSFYMSLQMNITVVVCAEFTVVPLFSPKK